MFKKKFFKTKDEVEITFEYSGKEAENVSLVGEFNGWSFLATPMKRLKSGAFTTILDLEQGREYQFRYLLDEKIWENDTEADKFVTTPFGDSENSVIVL